MKLRKKKSNTSFLAFRSLNISSNCYNTDCYKKRKNPKGTNYDFKYFSFIYIIMISENTLLWLIIALTIWDLIWKDLLYGKHVKWPYALVWSYACFKHNWNIANIVYLCFLQNTNWAKKEPKQQIRNKLYSSNFLFSFILF